MTDAPNDNPAGRLHRIMAGMLSADGSIPIMQVLQQQCDAEAQPYNVVLRELAKFVDLPPQIYDAVHAIEGENYELLLRWQGHFNDILPWLLGPAQPVNNIQAIFTATDLLALEYCADLLHRKAPEVTIAEDKLPDLVNLVREAIDAIGADDGLPVTIRMDLISRLRDVETALVFFRTAGYGGVEEAMDKLAGTIFRSGQAGRPSETMTWWQKLWANIGLAVTGTKAVGAGIESTVKAIEAVQHLH